jgi:hypothetical protein
MAARATHNSSRLPTIGRSALICQNRAIARNHPRGLVRAHTESTAHPARAEQIPREGMI